MEDVFSKVKEMKAKEFPTRKVSIINEDVGCSDLLDYLTDEENPVTMVFNDKGKYQGIITLDNLITLLEPRKTDITEVLTRTHVLSCITAFDLIKSSTPVINDDDTIEKVAGLMDKYNTIYLPRRTNRKSEITGMIFLKDIIKVLKENWVGACIDMDD